MKEFWEVIKVAFYAFLCFFGVALMWNGISGRDYAFGAVLTVLGYISLNDWCRKG